MKSGKPLLVICTSLMVTATLIGAIDYSHSSKSGMLKGLYKDEPGAVNILNKEINSKQYSRGPLRDDKAYASSENANEISKTVYKEQDKIVERKAVKRKASNKIYLGSSHKLRLEDFSRAPIRIRKEDREEVKQADADSAVVKE